MGTNEEYQEACKKLTKRYLSYLREEVRVARKSIADGNIASKTDEALFLMDSNTSITIDFFRHCINCAFGKQSSLNCSDLKILEYPVSSILKDILTAGNFEELEAWIVVQVCIRGLELASEKYWGG